MNIIGGIISGLFAAWILSWFGVNHLLVSAFQPFFATHLNNGMYYATFAIIGGVSGAFAWKKN